MPLDPPPGLLLTPTAASARQLRRAFDAEQRARALRAWEPAPILAWSQWLESLFTEAITSGIETRLLLNAAQEHSLWTEVVANTGSLTSPDALANLAASAWTLANAYAAVPRLKPTANTHDSRTFAAWAEAFATRCTREGYITRATLEATLQQHFENRTLPAPPTLTLTGFPTELSPAQQHLLNTLTAAGTSITRIAPTAPTPCQGTILKAPTEKAELEAAANYARAFLLQNLQATIAILVPPDEDQAALEPTLREILAPELQSVNADNSSTPWELSANPRLANIPLIATALDLAHWLAGPLDLNNISALLLSPYLGTPNREAAGQFDAQVLRRAKPLRPQLDIPAILRLTQANTPQTPDWLRAVHQFTQKSPKLDTARTFSDWAELLRDLLKSAGFPGQRSLTSLEFAATQAWDNLLDQLSTLDFRGRRIPYAIALSNLQRLAADTRFQPPATNAPIQILTPSAATGLTFDAILLLRATDANYPLTERTHPLLSWPLQSTLNMPGTSPTQAAARARESLDHLLAAAPNILFTYAAETPEGPQRLAPILADLNFPELTPPNPNTHPAPIATIATPDITALPPLPSTEISGGSQLLKLQAACGFLAFSQLRLRSTELDNPTLGFDALESGNFLHRALQSFWQQVGSQQALRDMPTADREALITRCVDIAVTARIESPWDSAYLDIQKERLRTVIRNWLEIELQRGPFEVIGLEQQAQVQVGPLTLNVRIDRLDRILTADGSPGGHLFVDYKTGYAANPSQWEDARPEEPQLPLYALLSQPGELKGIAFAKVRAGKQMSWLGYQSEPGILPQKKPVTVDLDTAIINWRASLSSLAQDFATGIADVNPKDFAANCTRCAQRLLCRINPETFLATAESEDEEAGDDDQ